MKKDGQLCPYANMSKQLLWAAETVKEAWQKKNPAGKFEWKHNALRHSFISYRVADNQNVARVALEAGNSPRMVFSNYRELVRPVDAKKWFDIRPEGCVAESKDRSKATEANNATEPTNIVQLPRVAAEG